MPQQGFVEGAVGVRNKGPGHAVDARQPHQRRVLQHRQRTVVARRQAFADFPQLAFDQVEVVKQPFGRGADVVPFVGLVRDVLVGRPQAADVALQARVERGLAEARAPGPVRLAQAAAVLLEPGNAKELGADRFECDAARGVQHALDFRRDPGPLRLQADGSHLQHEPGATEQQREHHRRRDHAPGQDALELVGPAPQHLQPPALGAAMGQVVAQRCALQRRDVRRVAQRRGGPVGGQ